MFEVDDHFMRIVMLIFLLLLILMLPLSASGQPLDISDRSMEKILGTPFQYDYTRITDDGEMRSFIDSLDRYFATIEYRRLKQYTAGKYIPAGIDSSNRRDFSEQLESRYLDLLADGYLFQKLDQQSEKTDDPIIKAFVKKMTALREDFVVDHQLIDYARELAGRLADRLYRFIFKVKGKTYNSAEAARIVDQGSDRNLIRDLYRLQNDSAAVLAADAARLYFIYSGMGEYKGYPTSFDQNISALSVDKNDWLAISKGILEITEEEYKRCLEAVSHEYKTDNPTLVEMERFFRDRNRLPDSCFSAEKSAAAIKQLLSGLGLDSLPDLINIRPIDSGTIPALAIRLLPPDDNLFLRSGQSGFDAYRRLAAEWGRCLVWVYSDKSLPYLLRDYPTGTEESLAILFENLALRKNYLSDNFDIAENELERFVECDRWMSIFQMRRMVMFFLFDYNLSQKIETDPKELYWSLEKSCLGVNDSSFLWIETLMTGNLQRYPRWLSHIFSNFKIQEILFARLGETYADNQQAGPFLIESFCRPGQSRTLDQFITRYSKNKYSIDDIKRQLGIE